MSHMTSAYCAYGPFTIDEPFYDFADPEAYIAATKRATTLSIEGK